MTVSDLCFSDSGLVITVPRSKAEKEQAGDKVGIPFGEHDDTCPIKALRAWCPLPKSPKTLSSAKSIVTATLHPQNRIATQSQRSSKRRWRGQA